jgi:hypothetical protein
VSLQNDLISLCQCQRGSVDTYRGMFDGLLIGILLHQFACWIGDSRKQEVLWTKLMVVSDWTFARVRWADVQYYLVLVAFAHSS